MKPLISVIVPVYNVELYLAQCIESILNQTLREIELILVDDGSTDGSMEICDRYAVKDYRIKVLHQMNKGPIVARRMGLMESQAEYVTFVDADDFIDHNSYALAVPSIQNEIDVVIFGITRYIEENNQKKEKCDYNEGVYHKKEIEKVIWPQMIWNIEEEHYGIDPSLCNKVMRRSLLMPCYQNICHTNFHYGEDAAIVYPMLRKAETIEIKNQSYYFHRQRKKDVNAGYLADAEFFDKLYMLYRYMMEQFADNLMFIEQIEYFYIYSVEFRKRIYGDYRERIRHLFPFDQVDKGMRIVIYGAGAVGQSYAEQLKRLDYCKVVLWVDKNFQKYNSDQVSGIEGIGTVTYDKIVIAIDSAAVSDGVREDLIAMGVQKEKIVK